MFDWTKKIFGDLNERELKKLQPIVEKISSYEPNILKMNDERLKNKTPEFRERLDKGETLDDILPEVFAVVREAAKRVTKMRPFDVQLIGGIILTIVGFLAWVALKIEEAVTPIGRAFSTVNIVQGPPGN